MPRKFLSLLIIITLFIVSFKVYSQQSINSNLAQFCAAYNNQIAKYKLILINTKLGCPTCSDWADIFLINNIDNKKILFVIPNLTRKEVNIKFKFDINLFDNVLIDKNNLVYKFNLINEKPLFYIIQEGVLVGTLEVEEVKSNPKWRKLYNLVLKR